MEKMGVMVLTVYLSKAIKAICQLHEWQGTKVRFELPDGKWGKFVDLIGKDGAMRFLVAQVVWQTISFKRQLYCCHSSRSRCRHHGIARVASIKYR
jgi:hypothetical protein